MVRVQEAKGYSNTNQEISNGVCNITRLIWTVLGATIQQCQDKR